ncbi:MAG: right-handed parallel beta-helix repeat-containing protein, partial [Planctomycetes bacterium]|nr:right-handed parallel beta-helix repeat-containing protein [Planctomycetota bacterium]
LPPEARGRVVQLDLNAVGVTDHGTLGPRGYGMAGYPTHPWVDLYVDGKPMQLARWPNEGFVRVGKVHQGEFRSDPSDAAAQFEYEGDRPQRWAGADEAWMFGYWVHLWAGRHVKVAAIDPGARRITAAHRASYGYREGQPYYYFNLLEELDQPGEWYLDRNSGLLYLYPPGELRGAVVQFPILSTPFVRMKNASHVTFRGLVFEVGRAEGAVITGGARNLLAGCTFRQLGTNAVIIGGGAGHGVLGCDLQTLGAGGVRATGGDRGTLTPGDHFVENCHISDFTRIDRVYAPAVHLDGVGNRIAHNLMHDSPHHGMRVEGYEHAIEFNEIHSVVYEADDQAGIDMFGNPAYRGNVIRHNYWHHIGSGHDVAGQSGIRLDDFISAVLVYGNVFHRSAGGRFGGVQIHGGKDNVVDNNLFVDCKSAISFSPWGEKRWLERLGRDSTRAAVARGGVNLDGPPHAVRYPELAQMTENADRNFIWRNLAIDCGRFSVRDRGVNEIMDNHILSRDSQPAGSPSRAFSLPEDSPVYDRFGFRPIPFDEIGLYQDEYRVTWPVEHDVTPHYFSEY